MKNIKNLNEANSLFQNNSLNQSNSDLTTTLNNELNNMKQDLLFFKNEILKDIRKIEEKLNLKINEQNKSNNEHYNLYEKRLDTLTTQINIANSMVFSNSDVIEKFNDFHNFKSGIELQLLNLNIRLNNIQKDNKELLDRFDKLNNENLSYPGIIGKNAKFQNIKHFFDYILNYFKEINKFKEEIKSFDINFFKKNVNNNLQEFRQAINDGYKNSLTLIENKSKNFDKKLSELINSNKKTLEEKEHQFHEFQNKMTECLEEYQTQIKELEKNLNDKHMEQLNEIDELKKIKNQLVEDVNNIKSYIETRKKNNESKKESDEYVVRIINNNYLSEGQHVLMKNNEDKISEKKLLDKKNETTFPLNLSNIINDNNTNTNNNTNVNSKGMQNLFIKEILNNNNNDKIDSSLEKNNNIFDKSQSNEEIINRNNNHKVNKIFNRTQTMNKSKSFDNFNDSLDIKEYNYIKDTNNLGKRKERFSLTQEDINNNKESLDNITLISPKYIEKKIYDNYKKDLVRNNYSISNIANIKLKKVLLPEFLTKRKNETSDFSISENKKYIMASKNTQNSFTINIEQKDLNQKKSFLDLSRMHKQKSDKIIKLSKSSQMIKKISDSKHNENLRSLILMNFRPKKNDLIIKKGKTRNSSFEKKKSERSVMVQTGLRNTEYMKHKFNEIILINQKNLSKNRKIKL